MGEVYLAQDPKLNRAVALKRIAPQLHEDEGYRARFLRGAERACGVKSPYVAAIYDVPAEDQTTSGSSPLENSASSTGEYQAQAKGPSSLSAAACPHPQHRPQIR